MDLVIKTLILMTLAAPAQAMMHWSQQVLGGDAAPLSYSPDDGISVYSELAAPDSRDEASIPNVGTLRRGTQLRKGERVKVVGPRSGDYTFVNLPQQNYSGWVRTDQISEDTGLAAFFPAQRSPGADEAQDPLRQGFLQETKVFEDKRTPYEWGGMTYKGVDCSGLVKASMDKAGLGERVPRVSADQHKASTKINNGSELQPGDLIFTAKDGTTVSHVVVYIGGGMIREAQQSGTVVHSSDGSQRFGVDLKNAAYGTKGGNGATLFFGTFFQR